jgi:hypothetical protein
VGRGVTYYNGPSPSAHPRLPIGQLQGCQMTMVTANNGSKNISGCEKIAEIVADTNRVRGKAGREGWQRSGNTGHLLNGPSSAAHPRTPIGRRAHCRGI